MSGTTTHVDYLKRLTADLRRTRRRLSDLEAKLSEPVAVVGMGCRYPRWGGFAGDVVGAGGPGP